MKGERIKVRVKDRDRDSLIGPLQEIETDCGFRIYRVWTTIEDSGEEALSPTPKGGALMVSSPNFAAMKKHPLVEVDGEKPKAADPPKVADPPVEAPMAQRRRDKK